MTDKIQRKLVGGSRDGGTALVHPAIIYYHRTCEHSKCDLSELKDGGRVYFGEYEEYKLQPNGEMHIT